MYVVQFRIDGRLAYLASTTIEDVNAFDHYVLGTTLQVTNCLSKAQQYHAISHAKAVFKFLTMADIDGLATVEYYDPIKAKTPPNSELTLDRWNCLFEAELKRARSRPNTNFVALIREVGGVAKAMMESPGSVVVLEELVRVAVMAYRCASEGDVSTGHTWDYEQYRQMEQ